MKDEFDQILQSSRSSNAVGVMPGVTSSSRMLHIDPSGFQQYGPEMRTQHPHRLNEEGTQGYSGMLVIHLLGVRGLQVSSGVDSGASSALASRYTHPKPPKSPQSAVALLVQECQSFAFLSRV